MNLSLKHITLLILFSTFADINAAELTDAEKQINFLKGISSTCYWVDGVGKSGIDQVYANKTNVGGAAVICSGTLQCRADKSAIKAIDSSFPGTYWPIIYFEDVTCIGEKLTSGRVKCGANGDAMDCLRSSMGHKKLTVDRKNETQFIVSPSNPAIHPANFEKVNVSK